MGKIGIKQATKDGWIEIRVPGCADFSYPTSEFRRGRVQGGYDKPHNYNNYRSMQDYRMAKEIITIGFYDRGTGKHQSNTVYHGRGLIPALTTLQGGTQQIKVLKRYGQKRCDNCRL